MNVNDDDDHRISRERVSAAFSEPLRITNIVGVLIVHV